VVGSVSAGLTRSAAVQQKILVSWSISSSVIGVCPRNFAEIWG
jgi:hypothetical protein